MEIRINQKIDRLTTTLDKFLKRLTDMEDEFEIIKADINRMKKIIREKLGVEFIDAVRRISQGEDTVLRCKPGLGEDEKKKLSYLFDKIPLNYALFTALSTIIFIKPTFSKLFTPQAR